MLWNLSLFLAENQAYGVVTIFRIGILISRNFSITMFIGKPNQLGNPLLVCAETYLMNSFGSCEFGSQC